MADTSNEVELLTAGLLETSALDDFEFGYDSGSAVVGSTCFYVEAPDHIPVAMDVVTLISAHLEPLADRGPAAWDLWTPHGVNAFKVFARTVRQHLPVEVSVIDVGSSVRVSGLSYYAAHRSPARSYRPPSTELRRGRDIQVVDPEFTIEPSESPWADAIGPVYTLDGAAASLGMSRDALRHSIDLESVLAIEIEDPPTYVLPAAQFYEGRVVPGLAWILGQLPARAVDRASLASWLNQSQQELDGSSIWAAVRGAHDHVPQVVEQLVAEFRSVLLQ